jgi:hypothetical protein
VNKCPRCFNVLPAELFCWTESKPRTLTVDELATAYRGHPVSMGNVANVEWPAGSAPNWQSAAEHAATQLEGPIEELCPICHYTLPPNWRWGVATCIAMAGARSTGKTVFIAVMIKQFQKLFEKIYNQVVVAADDATERRYREVYEHPLFVERGILSATQPARAEDSQQHDSLIFSLGVYGGISRFLVVRDVAGEDLEDTSGNIGGLPWAFFSAADAVLFLFDPMRVEEVKDQLTDLVPTDQVTGGDPRDVLRTVMKLIGSGNPKLAVILSKFDALQALRNVRGGRWSEIMSHAGAAFSRDPSLLGGEYDQADGALLDAEVRSLLQRLDAGAMFRTMTDPMTGRTFDHRFFAVSALGESPEGQRLNASGISPFRCTDPVRWVLAG